ncbi:hypothetical protein [Helicobacter pylori]|uniref:hypothetical protein n=1 Tax=Helicobacter pylori TaxID=210 RepID=UPI0036F31AF5
MCFGVAVTLFVVLGVGIFGVNFLDSAWLVFSFDDEKTAKIARPTRKVIARYHIFYLLLVLLSVLLIVLLVLIFLVPLSVLLLVPLSVLGVRRRPKRMTERLPYKPALQD